MIIFSKKYVLDLDSEREQAIGIRVPSQNERQTKKL